MTQKQLSRHKKNLYVAFIDFRKAFDFVCRGTLWNILYKNGLNGKSVNALKNMYEVVKSKVGAGGDFIEVFMCPQGLKQGDVCSPVFFSLFVNV